MSDNYGARCDECHKREPSCCGLCTVCVRALMAEIKELRSRLALEMDKKISASLNGYLIGVQGEG